MKYYLLSNSVIVIDNEKTYTISSGDRRYKSIKESINNNDLDKIRTILEPDNIIGDGFAIKNGLVTYQDSPIPSVLGNRFLELTKDSWEFKSIFNFWFNIKTRVKSDEASKIINKLLEKNAYSITEDGFYLVYDDKDVDQTNSALNKKNQIEIFHFYNYAQCPTCYYNKFAARNSLNSILEESFGFITKKLKKMAIDAMFVEDSNFVNYKFLLYGEALKDVLARDNIFFAIEKELIHVNHYGDVPNYKELNTLLKDLSINKEGGYSQKKVINFLQGCDSLNKEKLAEIGNYYTAVKSEFDIDIQDLKTNNFQEIYEYLQREYGRIKDPIFFLNNDSIIDNLSEEEFDRFKIVVPKTNHDLKAWGVELHHCVGSYASNVKNKECQIIGIANKNNGNLIYNIEITRNHINQFRGKRNCSPDLGDKNIIEDFLKSNGVIYKE
jgi:hypothetical protein